MKPENRVEEVMNSLQGMQKAKAPRDSFAKIQQKLADQRKQQQPIKQPSGYGWMKIAAVITLVVCSNIWAVTNFFASGNIASEQLGSYPQIVADFNLYDNE